MKHATPPQDDPVSVTLVAAQLIGRACQGWDEALVEARRALALAPGVIGREKEVEEISRAIDNDIWTDPIPERVFVDRMVEGLCSDKRAARQKEFLFRMWPKLRAVDQSAPSLGDPLMFTEGTLRDYQGAFQSVCRNHAKEVRRANAKKPRRRRQKKILKKSLASALAA